MTDLFSDINSEGGIGRSPITQAGRVATNGHLDENEILERKDRLRQRTSLFTGLEDDPSFSIFRREICLQLKTNRNHVRNRYKFNAAYILSTLNGAFKKTDKVWEAIEQLEFQGLAGGQGAKYDSSYNNPEIDVSLVRGGMITMVNTGPKKIQNGDHVYWTLPDPENPYQKESRGKYRILPQTLPYDTKLDIFTETSLREMITEKNYTESDIDSRYPILEGIKNFKQVIMQIHLNALHTFLMSGIVVIDEEALEFDKKDKRNANRRTYQDREGILIRIAKQLELRDMANSYTKDSKIKFNPFPENTEREIDLIDYAMKILLAQERNSFLLPLDEASDAVPAGPRGTIIKNQRSLLSDFFSSVNSVTEFTRKRIFGKAISPADPQKEFDIYLGKYSS